MRNGAQITCFVLSRKWAICLTYLADGQYLKGTVASTTKALTISNQMEREIMAFWDLVPDVFMMCCPHEFMRTVMTLWIKVVGSTWFVRCIGFCGRSLSWGRAKVMHVYPKVRTLDFISINVLKGLLGLVCLPTPCTIFANLKYRHPLKCGLLHPYSLWFAVSPHRTLL